MDLFKHIVFVARMVEDEPALATVDGVVTYRALLNAVEAACEVLGVLDLDDSNVVVIDVKNQFFHVVLMLALGLRGIPSASMQTLMSVERSGLKPPVLLTDSKGLALAGSKVVEVTPTWFAKQGDRPNYRALMALRGFTSDADLVRVSFSSGTTGFPKAVGMRLGRLMNYIGYPIVVSGFERTLMMAGPSVAYTTILQQFARGGLMALSPKPEEAAHLIRVFAITGVQLAVAQLQGLLGALDGKRPLTSLRYVACFGSKLITPLMQQARQKLSNHLILAYASSEAGLMSWATADLLTAREGVTGYVVPGVQLQAVDSEHQPVPAGQTGLIRVKTPFMQEYLVPTPETDAMYRDGWFYPGDVGSIDADGLVIIEGRSTEVINHGGAIVAPELIEEVLKTVPGIRDAAVFGVVNANGIEDIWAGVLSDVPVDQAAIIAQIRGRLMEKVPQRIVSVAEIPRTEGQGKVMRGAVREMALAQTSGR